MPVTSRRAPAAAPGRGSVVWRAPRVIGCHPFATDAVGAVLLAVAMVVIELRRPGRAGSSHSAALLTAALVLPLVLRRRRPVPVFFVIALMELWHFAFRLPVGGDIAVLIALYTVGVHESRRWILTLVGAAGGAGVIMAVLTWAPAGGLTWSSFVFTTGTITAALVLGIYVRTRRAYLQSVLDRAATLEREHDQEAQIAVAAERARIAREMHDVVAHSLSVMIALSDGAAASSSRDPEQAADVMRKAGLVGRQALGEMRHLLGVLRDDDEQTLVPQPGDDDLVELVTRVRSAGLAVDLVVTGLPSQSSAGAQLAVHRIVQESLTNILKHAPTANLAVVTVRYAPDWIDVEVSDDAQGGEPLSVAATGQGHGLTGMRERAAVYGGALHAGRAPGGGWRVTTRLQVDSQQALR